jgi:neutral ceramidase
MNRKHLVIGIFLALLAIGRASALEDEPVIFKAGFASVDITPEASVPMWGYGHEHRPENNSTGVHDLLYAKALVFEAGDTRAALVGLDLGRAPFEPMVRRIEQAVLRQAGVEHVFLVGSHTHHGPALELVPVEGNADPALQNAFAYYDQLEQRLIEVITEAASKLVPAKIGWASAESNVNRNRHTQEAPIPRDPELFTLRVDDLDGKPIAILVNFAAHPTNHPHGNNKLSADYPGVMMAAVQEATGAPCLFLQGAAGDMQCDVDDSQWGKVDQMVEPGQQLAKEVLTLNGAIATTTPARPDLRGERASFSFKLRLDLNDPSVTEGMRAEYGESLHKSYQTKYSDGLMHPKLTTLLINGELAIGGGSGEFFSDHSVQLKRRVEGVKTIFTGYCNGHDMYFPTLRAIEQGGYGADPASAWVTPGGPEKMIDRAVYSIRDLVKQTQPVAPTNATQTPK